MILQYTHFYQSLSALLIFTTCASNNQNIANPELARLNNETTSAHEVTIHPPFLERFTCTEHPYGELPYVGDALGRDCHVVRLVEDKGRLWLRAYKNEGMENEDWYAWNTDILAPFDGEVSDVHLNDEINQPGIMGKGRASAIIFKRKDGVKVILAHLQNVKVKKGDLCSAGDIVGNVGNNGYSRHPHLHIGAWLEQTPLQIRMNLRLQRL